MSEKTFFFLAFTTIGILSLVIVYFTMGALFFNVPLAVCKTACGY
jgi:hypothetical protein